MNETADFLFRCNPEPGWIEDRDTRRFLAVNQAAVAAYGYSEDEFLGMTVADIRLADGHPQAPKQDGSQHPAPADPRRWRHRRKNGEVIVVELRAFPVVFMDRPAEIVTARDVTDLVLLEMTAAKQLRKEREATTLLAMAGRVARFGGWRVDLATSEVVWSDETAAIHEVPNGALMLQEGLSYYVPEQRPIIETAFRACVEQGVPFAPILQRSLSEDLSLEIVSGGDLWAATVDPGQLETALLNLTVNARDSMEGGGRLTISTRNVLLDQDFAPTHEAATAGQYVVISVSDTGSGMPPEIASRAFEPFFTTKEAGKGAGLGLSMVYGFAKQSSGHVKIDSTPDEGTTVHLYLPRSQGDQLWGRPTGEAIASLPSGTERILLVEDDLMVREHVARLLRGLGYQVSESPDGAGAVEKLARGETFDLLFTDIVMPGGMNGHDLSVIARRICPALKVLCTSGYAEDAIVHQGRLDPGVQLLKKPYRKRDLAMRIRKVLGQ